MQQTRDEKLVPLVRAAGELHVGYLAARNLALKGELELHWLASRMYVSRESLERLKADRIQPEPAA